MLLFCRQALCLLAAGLFSLSAGAQACRLAFDVGSSGVRAGTVVADLPKRTALDSLSLLAQENARAEAVRRTVAVFDQVSAGVGNAGCQRLAGGFSAWRRVLANDRQATADLLAGIESANGVRLVVIPQDREGSYAYVGARALLGTAWPEARQAVWVLDLGGGSLQVANAHTSYGVALGQKTARQSLCKLLRAEEECSLQALSADELAKAGSALRQQLKVAGFSQDGGIALGALLSVSRPVTGSIRPALVRLGLIAPSDSDRISRSAVTAAIRQLAPLSVADLAAQTGVAPPFAGYVLSDLLLIEAVMERFLVQELRVADIELTNVPGLLQDEQAWGWTIRYGCYLSRVKTMGEAAFYSDQATCP